MAQFEDRLILHTWTLDTTPLAPALEAAKKAGWNGVELRHVDFERCHQSGMSNQQVVDLVRASGVKVGVMGVEYGALFAKGEERKRLLKSVDVTCANARALGCGMLMTANGPGAGTMRDAIDGLKAAAAVVAGHGLRIAYEYSSAHEWLNTLGLARELLAAVANPACGLLVDAYHFERSGAGGRGFADVPANEIFAFQFSDVPDAPLAGGGPPTDRLLPGRGRVRWKEVFALLAEKNYGGWLSCEAPNPETWARAPEEAAREALAATRALLR
ncbi:MAG: sugar phosphate isomerase/epimerase [Burkholderiales bacterium]|nr:sugar phosphate isomerase/epimerase [Burkholderiales bacterium]